MVSGIDTGLAWLGFGTGGFGHGHAYALVVFGIAGVVWYVGRVKVAAQCRLFFGHTARWQGVFKFTGRFSFASEFARGRLVVGMAIGDALARHAG